MRTERSFGVRAACCRFPSRKLACGSFHHKHNPHLAPDFLVTSEFPASKLVGQKRQQAARTPKLRSSCHERRGWRNPALPLLCREFDVQAAFRHHLVRQLTDKLAATTSNCNTTLCSPLSAGCAKLWPCRSHLRFPTILQPRFRRSARTALRLLLKTLGCNNLP